jgi:hypothetical protein
MDVTISPRDEPMTRAGTGWLGSVALGLVLFLVYIANNRELASYDTEPTTLLTYCLLKGDGPYLDRFRPFLEGPGGYLPEFATRSRGHIVSLYPIGPALLAVPLAWPQVLLMDHLRPGWDRVPQTAYKTIKGMVRVAAAAIVALVGVALGRVLRGLGLGRVAPATVLAAGLGSNLWASSLALWQHGPAALALTLTVALLLPRPASPRRLALAGLTTAALVAFRSIDLVFALAILAWLAWHQPRGLAWFLPVPLVLGGALVAYNLRFFGTIAGGQALLESMHPALHGVPGAWSGDVVGGTLGTLFSPSRGLFLFTPWVALTLALLPAYADRVRPWSLVRWLLWALVPYHLLITKYAVWWAGHCFGPRYWADVIPLFAILLAFCLDWSMSRWRPAALLLTLAILWGVAVQAIGAFLYPSGWNLTPTNVDTHHERLWDWSDTELSRCLIDALGRR